jgi:hypothetical protein
MTIKADKYKSFRTPERLKAIDRNRFQERKQQRNQWQFDEDEEDEREKNDG